MDSAFLQKHDFMFDRIIALQFEDLTHFPNLRKIWLKST